MFQQMPFIGREDELEQIDNLIKEWGTRRVLCIDGLGGIGKTRLLAEIQGLYTNYEEIPLLVTDILDFDERSLHLAENIESQMASQLDKQAFGPYLHRLVDLRKIAAAGVSAQTLKEDSERVQQLFIETFNQLSEDRRLVLLLDTTEKLQSEEIWDRVINLMVESKNALFLLAGRNAKELWQALEFQLGDDAKLIELNPFEIKYGKQYLYQKQRFLHINLHPQILVPKLLWLAGGRPILLDLAVEWLSRDLPLDWMAEKTLEELESLSQEEMTQYKEDFEIQLVRNITQIRNQMDRLTLVMSRVYPLKPAMIAKLLRIREDDGKTLFEDAQTYVFVKSLPDGRISLHDEMRRMVNEYVWREVDPQERRRRRDSKIAAQLFEEEDKQLKKRLQQRIQPDLGSLFEREALARHRQVVNEQWIEHALYSDPTSGFQVWKRIVGERRTAKEFRFSKMLVKLAQPHFEQFDAEKQFDVDMLDARLSSDIGEVDEAEKMLHELLANNQGRQEREASIYNALGLVEEKLGKLEKARDHQLKCLKIVQKINKASIPAVANRVGYVHRVLGEFKEAEKYYKLALNANVDIETFDKKNLYISASILNNLAYVYGLQRKNSKMELYCRQAISTWKSVGATKEIGRAESTRAIFERDNGRYLEAIKLFKSAISRYQEQDDNEQLCRTYFHLGWTQWYQAEIVGEQETDITSLNWDIDWLNKAKLSLETSLELSEEYGLGRLLPKILHQTASVYWYIGHVQNDSLLIQEARKLNARSHDQSKQKGDIRYIVDSLLGEAEWDYEIGQYDKIESGYYRKILDEYEAYKHRYPLYFGRMARIEADLNFKRENYELAFPKYSEGLVLINQHGGFSRYTIEREILRLENKMHRDMSSEQITKWVKYLHDKWSQIEDQDTDFLTTWCEGELLRARLRLVE